MVIIEIDCCSLLCWQPTGSNAAETRQNCYLADSIIWDIIPNNHRAIEVVRTDARSIYPPGLELGHSDRAQPLLHLVFLFKAINASGCIDQSLVSGVVGMAIGADLNVHIPTC